MSTPVFDPERLRLAREDAGLSKKDLAEKVHVSPSAITQYEAGTTAPRHSVQSELALACGFPVRFFQLDGRPTRPSDVDEPFFRSLRSTRQWERTEAKAKAAMVWRLVQEIERHVELPPVAFDDLHVDDDTTSDAIEALAIELRASWSIEAGPAPSIVEILESRGAVACRVRPRSEKVDAFSQRIGGRPVVMLWSTKEDGGRSRFDAAHELGHLVLHPDSDPGNQRYERQAHQFAASFLMPAREIIDELPTRPPRKSDQRRLLELKRYWGVSVAALLYRARELGRLSEADHRQSMIRLSAWGWRRKEPLDIPLEQPSLLRRSIELLEMHGVTDIDGLARDLAVPVARIEGICGIGRLALPGLDSASGRIVDLVR